MQEAINKLSDVPGDVEINVDDDFNEVPGITWIDEDKVPCTKDYFASYKNEETDPVKKEEARDKITKMSCMKYPFQIQGDYNSFKGESLVVLFENCIGTYTYVSEDGKEVEKPCASEAKIKLWLRDKYIVILENERIYVQHEHSLEKAFKEESRLFWYNIDPEIRVDIPKTVIRSDVVIDSIPWGV